MGKLMKDVITNNINKIATTTGLTILICFIITNMVTCNERQVQDKYLAKDVKCIVLNVTKEDTHVEFDFKTLDDFYFSDWSREGKNYNFRAGDTVVVKMGKYSTWGIYPLKPRN